MKTYKRILSIAGSDSGGGAGIQADIKTISACGGFAMTVITAITVQNTRGVSDIHLIPADIVAKQISAVIEDIGVDAVKLGMLPTAEIIVAAAQLLRKYKVRNIVMDPVMISTSGHKLIDPQAVQAIVEHILPICDVITPNIPETEYLTGVKIDPNGLNLNWEAALLPETVTGQPTEGSNIVDKWDTTKRISDASRVLMAKGASGVVIKSGHLKGESLTDYLFCGNEKYEYNYRRIDTRNTHGTGCTLSSAIAAFLAHGHDLPTAVGLGEDYIHKAILAGSQYSIGSGHGPVHHFFGFWE